MLSLSAAVQIFLFSEPCDMRKGFDGLCGLVRRHGQDVFSGHLFVFVSKRRDRLKILTWERGGFVMYYKRLEKGRFKLARSHGGSAQITLSSSDLAMLLDGIEYHRVRKPDLWSPKKALDKSLKA